MTAMRTGEALTVCYNGACPVCRAEVDHYRALAEPGDGLTFLDVSAEPAGAVHPRLAGDAAFRRLHALTADGRLLAGIDAFAALWERLPRYRWLARIMRLRPVRRAADLAYDHAAAPLLFRRHQRRQRQALSAGHQAAAGTEPEPPR